MAAAPAEARAGRTAGGGGPTAAHRAHSHRRRQTMQTPSRGGTPPGAQRAHQAAAHVARAHTRRIMTKRSHAWQCPKRDTAGFTIAAMTMLPRRRAEVASQLK